MQHRLTMAALVMLAGVVAVQGYYLFRLSHQQAPAAAVSTPLQPPATDLRHWDPYLELRRMQEEMNQRFGDSLSRLQLDPDFVVPFTDPIASPPADIRETGDGWEVRLNIPGAIEQEIQVDLDGQVLHIRARTQEERSLQEQGMVRQERFIGQFERSLTLPGAARPGSLQTEYVDGVLTVRVARAAA